MTEERKTDFGDIELLVMDVDGVLTDGTVIINGDGREGKSFNLLDGHGIRMWQRAGGKCAFLSGRFSQATQYRAEQLEIDYCVQPFDFVSHEATKSQSQLDISKKQKNSSCPGAFVAGVERFEKLAALKKLLEDAGVSAKRTAYIGDDLLDLPVIRYVGFGAAVANAVEEVKEEADYVTTRRGGDGAVREVIEYILKKGGKWRY